MDNLQLFPSGWWFVIRAFSSQRRISDRKISAGHRIWIELKINFELISRDSIC